MGELPLYIRIKQWFGSIAFKIFLWCNDYTENEYFNEIYSCDGDYKTKLRNFLVALEYNRIEDILTKDPKFFTDLGNEAKVMTLKLIK